MEHLLGLEVLVAASPVLRLMPWVLLLAPPGQRSAIPPTGRGGRAVTAAGPAMQRFRATGTHP